MVYMIRMHCIGPSYTCIFKASIFLQLGSQILLPDFQNLSAKKKKFTFPIFSWDAFFLLANFSIELWDWGKTTWFLFQFKFSPFSLQYLYCEPKKCWVNKLFNTILYSLYFRFLECLSMESALVVEMKLLLSTKMVSSRKCWHNLPGVIPH